MMIRIATLLPPLALLAACGSPAPAPIAGNSADAAPEAAAAAIDLEGKWLGPEGLYFQVSPGSDDAHYKILNRWTLDDEASFVATREGGTISFVREGTSERARIGTGAETGFKWLADKKDCLIVKAGVEGYCRD